MQTELASTPEVASGGQLVNISDDAAAAAKAIAVANAFTVEDAESSVMAQETRAKLNTRIKDLTERRMSITRKIDEAKKDVMALFAGPIGVLTQAMGIFDSKVIAYDDEQNRLRKEAQRKVEAAAATERKRLQDEADERIRKADAEAAAKRKAAYDAAAAGRIEEAAKLNAQASKVEEKAAARVEVLQERASQVVAPILQAQTAKASGSSFRDNWKFEVIDASKISDAFMMRVPNEVAIAALVKSMHEGAADLVGAGIRIYNDRGLASKRA